MKTRTTIFDSRISAIADILNAAVNTDVEHQIPERYIGYFCELVVNSMWRSVSNAIAGMELYGEVVGFIFNMGGGNIDNMYDIELAVKYMEEKPKPFGTFRNMEHIAWECRDGKLTAEEIYDIFLSQARKLMHYKEKEE
jgi:hypothetical protein